MLKFAGAAVMILLVLGGSNFYLAQRISRCVRFLLPKAPFWIFPGSFGGMTLVMILSFFRSTLPIAPQIRTLLGVITAYWMGIFLYLLLFFLLADLVLLAGQLTKRIPVSAKQKAQFLAGATALVLALCTALYGFYHATQLKTVRYDLSLPNAALGQEMTIVMISDLHLGAIQSENRLADIIDEINGLEPDLVCIAGDFFDSDYQAIRDPDAAASTLQQLRATYGVYVSLGNHDAGATFGQMQAFLDLCGIRTLADEAVCIDDRLVLVGRLDPSPIGGYNGKTRQPLSQLLTGLHEDLPVVVMDHNPANADTYTSDVDLVLSGHTHKGQIFPGSLLTNYLFPVDYGWYQKDSGSPHVIVSSGVGTWGMPMRVGTDCEIVCIRLHP